MKLGFVGPSYVERSIPFSAQRSINLFPVVNEAEQGVAALYGTPGLSRFVEAGGGPIRASFTSATGRSFVVSGTGLYEITASMTSTLLGTLNTGSGGCTIAENPTQLAVCDGEAVYTLTYATNAFAEVSDGDLPSSGTITFQDGYFIVNKVGSGSFYISALNDGTSWDALDFATAEYSPDNLVRVFSAYGQLWLFGEVSTEVWYNSGDIDFPFDRVEGAKMQVGCVAKHTILDMDNSVFWLGQDDNGRGIMFKTAGYSAQRISTHAIEYAIRQATNMSDIRAYSYQEDGHLFYALTGGGLATTLVYDAATGLWHERAYLNVDGTYSTHRAVTHTFAFGKHLVGDKDYGVIYEQSLDYYDDDGDEIKRQRVFTHLNDENRRFIVRELQIDFEYGVGLATGQGGDPLCWLETSGDVGKTWGPELQASIGAIGEYNTRAVWRRLGQFDSFTVRVTISDPVKVVILGAFLNA